MIIYSIYKATNKINGKCYIGFDSKWPHRKRSHKWASKTGDYKFYESIRKHGWDSFEWEVIYRSKNYEHTRDIMEPYFIKEYDSFKNGYNSTLGGEGTAGFFLTDEHKRKISDSHKGKKMAPFSDEAKKNMSLAKLGDKHPMYGKNHSEETKAKMSKSGLGKKKPPRTEEYRKRMSEIKKKYYAGKLVV